MLVKWGQNHLYFFRHHRVKIQPQTSPVPMINLHSATSSSIRKPCTLPTEYICVMIPKINDNYLHKSKDFYHDTNYGLSGVRTEFLCLSSTSVKIWKQRAINWKILYQESYVKSKFAIMDQYLVRCLDGHSPLITFGVCVSVYKSLQRLLRCRISNIQKLNSFVQRILKVIRNGCITPNPFPTDRRPLAYEWKRRTQYSVE